MARHHKPPDDIDRVVSTVRHLLKLKTRGVLANVWIDGGIIRIAYPHSPEVRHVISWSHAEELGKRRAA